MMKFAVPVLFLSLVLSLSQAKTSATVQAQESPKRSGLKNLTRTKSVLARVVPKAQRRLLATNDLTDGDDGPPGPNELDLQTSYRRPEVAAFTAQDEDDNDNVSDYVNVRLAVARARAMEAYRQKWQKKTDFS